VLPGSSHSAVVRVVDISDNSCRFKMLVAIQCNLVDNPRKLTTLRKQLLLPTASRTRMQWSNCRNLLIKMWDSFIKYRSRKLPYALVEYPTDNNPADYALCSNDRIVGIVRRSPLGLKTCSAKHSVTLRAQERLRAHLVHNLSISKNDFDNMMFFTMRTGWVSQIGYLIRKCRHY